MEQRQLALRAIGEAIGEAIGTGPRQLHVGNRSPRLLACPIVGHYLGCCTERANLYRVPGNTQEVAASHYTRSPDNAGSGTGAQSRTQSTYGGVLRGSVII